MHTSSRSTSHARLPISAYIAQNVWSLIIDPPRKLTRMALAREE